MAGCGLLFGYGNLGSGVLVMLCDTYKSGRFCKCRRCGWWIPADKVAFPVRRQCLGDAEPKQRVRGLGDAVEVVATVSGLAILAKIYQKIRKGSCGCEQRKAKLNKWAPFAGKKACDRENALPLVELSYKVTPPAPRE